MNSSNCCKADNTEIVCKRNTVCLFKHDPLFHSLPHDPRTRVCLVSLPNELSDHTNQKFGHTAEEVKKVDGESLFLVLSLFCFDIRDAMDQTCDGSPAQPPACIDNPPVMTSGIHTKLFEPSFKRALAVAGRPQT